MTMQGIKVRIVGDHITIMDNSRFQIDLDDHCHLLQVWNRQQATLHR